MDDIQDYWIEQGQIAPMDLFLSKNQSLTLGIQADLLINDSKIINKVKEGFNRGLFELALHGWNHTDYTKLSEQEQSKSIFNSNIKLLSLFSNKSKIFIPPEDYFNNDTLKAMQQNGINIISTAGYAEDAFDGGKSIFNASNISINQSNGSSSSSSSSSNHSLVFHMPETSSFKNYDQGKWIKNPINSIISNVTDNINKYGYAVITLHPQDFVKSDNNNTFTNQVDENQIKDLSTLIDYFVSKNIPIASFSKAIVIPQVQIQQYHCISGFTITGYFTPIESDYTGQKKVTINLGSVGNKEFDENFIKDVKIEGWGKTNDGSYIGFHDGKWFQSPHPLNSNGQPLIKGSAAVDNKIIPNLKQLTISTLVVPYNNETFSANDVGGAIKGKHVDVYTGEGKAAETETKRITSKDNVVCYN